jgi:predicted metalloprotease
MRWVSSGGRGGSVDHRHHRFADAATVWWKRFTDGVGRLNHTRTAAQDQARVEAESHGRLIPSGRLAAISGAGVLAVLVVLAIVGTPRQLAHDLFSRSTPRGPALERPGAPVVEQLQAVLADTGEVWGRVLGSYESPKLAFFDQSTGDLACGFPASAAGPFYCPLDRRIYIDLSFIDDLEKRSGSEGQFAKAFVIAHEVGHHIQNLSGLLGRVAATKAAAGEIEGDQLAIRQELQADCLAGIWAHHSGMVADGIGPGDIDAGLAATSSIGNETLQKRARGYVVPEDFTHGTSLQRADWFRRGLTSGQSEDCNAFEALVL